MRQITSTYDELGRLRKRTTSRSGLASCSTVGSGGDLLEYGYDRRDQTALTYPDGKLVVSSYDSAGRLQYLDDWRGSGSGRTTYGYDDADRRTHRTLPSGAYSGWSHDPSTALRAGFANRMLQTEHRASSGVAVLKRDTYTYAPNGNRDTQADQDGASTITRTFGHDARDHLTRWAGGCFKNPGWRQTGG